jgi:hypothetical protein
VALLVVDNVYFYQPLHPQHSDQVPFQPGILVAHYFDQKRNGVGPDLPHRQNSFLVFLSFRLEPIQPIIQILPAVSGLLRAKDQEQARPN